MKIQKMILKNNLITVLEFRKLHPQTVVSDTDLYFTSLANKIFRALKAERELFSDLDEHFLRQFALKSAAYFEDVVSHLGLFNGFRKLHLKKCGKKLPFYTIGRNYYNDEINLVDIQFLVWTIIQGKFNEDDKGRFINPENPGIRFISMVIFKILEEEYETAPENETIYELLHEQEYDNFFIFRDVLKWLYFDSYLSTNHPQNNFEKMKKSCQQEFKRDLQFPADKMIYLMKCNMIVNYACTPLSVKAIEWFRAITDNKSMLKKTEKFDSRPFQMYKIMEGNENIINLLPFGDNEKLIQFDSSSADIGSNYEAGKNAMRTALVFYNGLWRANGMVVTYEMDNEVQKNEDNNIIKQKKREENVLFSYETMLKANKNEPIAFCKNTDELKKLWCKAFPDSPNKDEFFNHSEFKDKQNFLIFLYPNNGIFVLPDAAKMIKYPNNNLYDKEFAATYAIAFLTGAYTAPLEFLEFVINNDYIPDICMNSLKGAEHGRQLVQQNKWFIVRFFQPDLFEGQIFIGI
jgi:hypothetical protein